MRSCRCLLIWFFACGVCSSFAQTSDYLLWAKTSEFTEGTLVRQSDLDSHQNLYVIGVTLQSVPAYNDPSQNIPIHYIFVSKYDKEGTLQWTKKYGSNREPSRGGDIRVDKDDNIIITGYLIDPDGTVFGQPWLGTFISKLDPDGNLIWISELSRTDGRTWGQVIQIFGNQSKIEIDDDNTIVAYTNYNPDAWPRPSHHGLYLTRYSANGALINQAQITNNDNADAPVIGGVAITSDHSIVVTGSFHVSLTMGAIILGTPGPQSNSPVRIFVAQFSSDGVLQWVKTTPGGLSAGFDVDTDDMGNIYLTGVAQGHSTLGGTIQINPQDPPSSFIAKLDSNGEIIWSKLIKGEPSIITRMQNDDLYITGSVNGSLVFQNYKIPRETEQAFAVKINADGSVGGIMVSDGVTPGSSYKIGYNSSIDNLGNVYTVGNFYQLAVFGCDTLKSTREDMFIIKHSHLPPAYNLDIDGPVVVCEGAKVELSLGPIPDPVKYFWQVPPRIQPGNIDGNEIEFLAPAAIDRAEVNIKIKKGCESYESASPYVVRVRRKPAPGNVAGDQVLCNPGTKRFLTTRNDDAFSYTWTLPEGIEAIGSSLQTVDPFIDVNIKSDFVQGQIVAAAVNECFQTETNPLDVRLVNKPGAISFIDTLPEVCFTSSPFQVSITPSQGANNYRWELSSNFIEAQQFTTAQTTVDLHGKFKGAAQVTVTPQNECHSGDPSVYSFTLSQLPDVPSIETSPCDREVSTTAIDNILWYRNETSFAKDTAIVTVPGEGDYYITTTNGCGTAQSTTLTLKPTLFDTFFVANVITPNHDNKNDYLVTAPKIDGLKVKVVNRWGNAVFNSSNYSYDWDGGDAAAGVYFIELRHQCLEKPILGTLEVVR